MQVIQDGVATRLVRIRFEPIQGPCAEVAHALLHANAAPRALNVV